MDDKQFIRQIRKAIKRLMVLGDTYFRFLHWCIECHTAPDPDQVRPFALGRKEILAMGLDTVGDFRGVWRGKDYDPSFWEEAKCFVHWGKRQFFPKKPYRDDFVSRSWPEACEGLCPIPSSAHVSRIEFMSPADEVPFDLVYKSIHCITTRLCDLEQQAGIDREVPYPDFAGCRCYDDVVRYAALPGMSLAFMQHQIEAGRAEYFERLSEVARALLTRRLSAPVRSRVPRISLTEANQIAREILRKTPDEELAGISYRKMAKAIGCSLGLAHKLPALRGVMERLGKTDTLRHTRHKRTRLTPGLEKMVGVDKNGTAKLYKDNRHK